jgi:hypothetical protein
MSNYQEQEVTGVEWRRAKRVVINNPLNAPREVRFDEESVIHTGSGLTAHSAHGYLSVPFDPDAIIDIYNPETGLPTGQTITQGDAYGILFSAYMTAAVARDAAHEPDEPEGEE